MGKCRRNREKKEAKQKIEQKILVKSCDELLHESPLNVNIKCDKTNALPVDNFDKKDFIVSIDEQKLDEERDFFVDEDEE